MNFKSDKKKSNGKDEDSGVKPLQKNLILKRVKNEYELIFLAVEYQYTPNSQHSFLYSGKESDSIATFDLPSLTLFIKITKLFKNVFFS